MDDTGTTAAVTAKDLRDKLGLSRSYAFELVKGIRTPSLQLAQRIEHELGIPPAHWVKATKAA